jgi:hypothetical protein
MKRKQLRINLPIRNIMTEKLSIDYQKIVTFIIDRLEGGYYHPAMLKDGRVKDIRYQYSGETMFGIDRKTGGSINTSKAGIEFWNIIDNCQASKNWKWNYKGGENAPRLKKLVSEMILPLYTNLLNLNMSPKAIDIINSSEQLTFNFVYATWNGAGWFRNFAINFNENVLNLLGDKKKLVDSCIAARKSTGNKLLLQGANTISNIINLLSI